MTRLNRRLICVLIRSVSLSARGKFRFMNVTGRGPAVSVLTNEMQAMDANHPLLCVCTQHISYNTLPSKLSLLELFLECEYALDHCSYFLILTHLTLVTHSHLNNISLKQSALSSYFTEGLLYSLQTILLLLQLQESAAYVIC